MINPDDQPPAVPEAPTPIKERSGQSFAGLAVSCRAAIMRAVQRVNLHQAVPATDAAGNGFIVLAQNSEPAPPLAATADRTPPFSISVFTDDLGQDRWLPAAASAFAYDGEVWFYPFQPTLSGTPLSLITAAAAPAVPPAGTQAWLKFAWQVDDVALVPDMPIYAARVTSVTVELLPLGDPAPDDDAANGITYRPWFTLGSAVNGVRPLDYQTLGYCHFWLFIKLLGGSSSSSSSSFSSSLSSSGSSGSSSGSSSPPSHQATFGVNLNGRRQYVTWGMILRQRATLRATFTVNLKKGGHVWSIPIPPEFVGSVQPHTIRVVSLWQDRWCGVPVVARAFAGELRVGTQAASATRSGRVTVQLEAVMAGASELPQYTDDAGRAHNLQFWNHSQ